jgi:hypothetical protein
VTNDPSERTNVIVKCCSSKTNMHNSNFPSISCLAFVPGAICAFVSVMILAVQCYYSKEDSAVFSPNQGVSSFKNYYI